MADRIRYYRVKNGNAFWAPGKQAEAFGFHASMPRGAVAGGFRNGARAWSDPDAIRNLNRKQ